MRAGRDRHARAESLDERMSLYREGKSDYQIAAAQGVLRTSIRVWRISRGLPANTDKRGQLTAEEDARRRACYDAGMSDLAIAQAEGVGGTSIEKWRTRRGLPANTQPTLSPHAGRPFTPAETAVRTLLYQMGFSDRQIAREQGVAATTVQAWRRRNGLAANRRQDRKACPGRDTTIERIQRAIGRRLPRDIADDAVSDLYLAVLSGEVDLERIESESRRFGNRVVGEFASKWGARSLDERLFDDGDSTLLDRLVDDSASGWLEEMGATVW